MSGSLVDPLPCRKNACLTEALGVRDIGKMADPQNRLSERDSGEGQQEHGCEDEAAEGSAQLPVVWWAERSSALRGNSNAELSAISRALYAAAGLTKNCHTASMTTEDKSLISQSALTLRWKT